MSQTIDLTDSELEFYSRQIVLPDIGYSGQLKLKKSKVCIVGLGGLGSPIALQLAAMGIGQLRLVDCDIVELSNLQRQHIYNTNYLGHPKVEVAAKKLNELNPNIRIEPLPQSLNEGNAEEIIGGVDVVVDGLDRMTPRYALNRASQKLNVPYIFAAAIMTYGNVSTIIPKKTPCLECFQGNLDDEALPKCSVMGVHPSILNIIASIEVSEAIRIILGYKPLLTNKILHCDIGNMEFEHIDITKADNCPVCSLNSSISPLPLEYKIINELCSRNGKRVFTIIPKRKLQIDINKLNSTLEKDGFEIKIKTSLSLGFNYNKKVKATILKSGIMIFEGVEFGEEAYRYFNNLIVDKLKIPRENIES
jgi:adenylyltransferase/sulfurtransferase